MMTDSTISLLQGIYYVVTGALPLISMKAFETITGPKTDLWLVKTTGLLIAIIGVTILSSRNGEPISRETTFLAIAAALGLGLIDVFYALKGTISKVYLIDAAAQVVIIGLWLI